MGSRSFTGARGRRPGAGGAAVAFKRHPPGDARGHTTAPG